VSEAIRSSILGKMRTFYYEANLLSGTPRIEAEPFALSVRTFKIKSLIIHQLKNDQIETSLT
jgi:hypothetical protein